MQTQPRDSVHESVAYPTSLGIPSKSWYKFKHLQRQPGRKMKFHPSSLRFQPPQQILC